MASRCFVGSVLVALELAAAAPAAVLYVNVPVSNNGTSNTIAYPNTSRNVVVGPDGTVYILYHNPSGIWVARSTNRGQCFQTPVRVGTSSCESEIASDTNGVVYVTWVEGGQATLSRSTDVGVSFSVPARKSMRGRQARPRSWPGRAERRWKTTRWRLTNPETVALAT